MLKRFQIKNYSKSNVLKQTISPALIMNDLSFTQTINWWQGELSIKLKLLFSDSTFIEWDLIKVSEFDDNNKLGRQIYYWFVSKVQRIQDTSQQYIELTCLGSFALLNNIIFNNSGFLPSYTADPATIIKAIIDYFNTKYTWSLLSYSGGNIDNYGSSVKISFDYTNCFDAISNVQKLTPTYYFFIDANWQVRYKLKPTSSSYTLTNQKDVESITVEEDFENVVNKYYLEWSWLAMNTYQDATSQTTYGVKEKYEKKTDISDAGTQNTAWNLFITQNKDPKKMVSISVNNKYDIETLQPWKSIKVVNFDYSINNLQILQTTYDIDKVSLTLEKLVTFSQQVVW